MGCSVDCGTYMGCTCVSVCNAVCSKVCESVGACASNWSTPANPKLTASYWTSLKSVLDNWLSHFFASASPAAVSAGARVLASDWNTKMRDPANTPTMTWSGSVLTSNVTLGVATAAVGDSVGKTGLKASDLVAKLNTRKCTTVYSSKTYTTRCICNSICLCNTDCSCKAGD